jgi:predicted kinase
MIILITGLPGSGKTLVASKLLSILSKEYFVKQYNTDVIRKKLFFSSTEDKTRIDRDFTKEELIRTYNCLYFVIEEVLSCNPKTIIITDGTYRTLKQRMTVKQIAEEHNVPYLLVQVKTEENILIPRIEKRFSEGIGSGVAGYKKVKPEYESPELEEEHYIIHNNDDLTRLEAKVAELVKIIHQTKNL